VPLALVCFPPGFGEVSFCVALRLSGSQTECLVGRRQNRVAFLAWLTVVVGSEVSTEREGSSDVPDHPRPA
jgi:hypothetical protein